MPLPPALRPLPGILPAKPRAPLFAAAWVLAASLAPATVVGAAGPAHQVIDETGRRIAIPEHPRRVVSLAPAITETLYALGAGDTIVGDTEYCDYPPEAARKPHVGAPLNPSLERIVALQPDLVFGSAEGNRRETADQLARLGIPLYGVSDRNLDDVIKTVRDLGGLLDAASEGEALAVGLERRIRAVEQAVAGKPRPRVLFVTWYQPLITIGPKSFVADVIRRAGGTSISDDLPGEWPRLSLEAVLERNPEVILVPRSQSYTPSLDDLRRTAGWRDLRAVKDGRVFLVPDTIVRPCPRLVDALEAVARVLHPGATAAPEGSR